METSFLSNKDRDTETETEGQEKRKAAERWHIGSETGTGKRRLGENQRQRDRGLKIETNQRGASGRELKAETCFTSVPWRQQVNCLPN